MSDRRLVLTWAVLMGLTTLTGIAGGALGAASLGAVWLTVLAVVTIAKARLILARYLRLAQAPAFLGGFTAAVVLVMTIVTLSVVAIRRPLLARPAAAVTAPHPYSPAARPSASPAPFR